MTVAMVQIRIVRVGVRFSLMAVQVTVFTTRINIFRMGMVVVIIIVTVQVNMSRLLMAMFMSMRRDIGENYSANQ